MELATCLVLVGGGEDRVQELCSHPVLVLEHLHGAEAGWMVRRVRRLLLPILQHGSLL
jgi:hypothetical protein